MNAYQLLPLVIAAALAGCGEKIPCDQHRDGTRHGDACGNSACRDTGANGCRSDTRRSRSQRSGRQR